MLRQIALAAAAPFERKRFAAGAVAADDELRCTKRRDDAGENDGEGDVTVERSSDISIVSL